MFSVSAPLRLKSQKLGRRDEDTYIFYVKAEIYRTQQIFSISVALRFHLVITEKSLKRFPWGEGSNEK